MSGHHYNYDKDRELEERLAKLKDETQKPLESDEELARHFSKVFGQQPVTSRLPDEIDADDENQLNNGPSSNPHLSNDSGEGNRPPMLARKTSIYSVPEDGSFSQDDVDRILASAQDLLSEGDLDDISFLDDLNFDEQAKKDIKVALLDTTGSSIFGNRNVSGMATSGGNSNNQMAQDLEETVAKFLKSQSSSSSLLHRQRGPSDGHEEQQQGDDQDNDPVLQDFTSRLGTSAQYDDESFTTSRAGGGAGVDDNVRQLMEKIREEAKLESKYGTEDEANLKNLQDRHAELKKEGIPGAATRAQKKQAEGKDGEADLGPPPMPVELNELTGLGGSGHRGMDDDPDNWCCICNEDAAWCCPGCDSDLYCGECYHESHVGPEADWEMKKHRPRPFVKGVTGQ